MSPDPAGISAEVPEGLRGGQLRRETPRINYYKTNHALGAKKEFFGWKPEDIQRKMSRLASVIDSFNCEGIAAHVTIADHADVFKGAKIFPGEYGNPYYLCAFLLVERIAIHYEWQNSQPNAEKVTKIDFVFDKQGTVGPMFKAQFDFWLKSRYKLLGECSHEDDRQFVPLQAADMYAAWVRRTASPNVQLWTSADAQLERIPKAAYHAIPRKWLQDVKQYAIEHSAEMAAFTAFFDATFQGRRGLRRRLSSRGSKLYPSG